MQRKDCTGLDLASVAGAVRVVKNSFSPVRARFASAAGVLHTREGMVAYETGDALLSGVQGEVWPVGKEFFAAHYAPVPPTQAGEDGTYAKKPLQVWAKCMREPFCVRIKHSVLSGEKGDWLVHYGPGEYGVVAASIFAATYSLVPEGELEPSRPAPAQPPKKR